MTAEKTDPQERYMDLAAYVGLVLSAISLLGAAEQACVLRAALEVLEARTVAPGRLG